jgi:cytochrome P450
VHPVPLAPLGGNNPTHLQITAHAVLSALYNIFLHPLRHIPGPLLWRASIWPWVFFSTGGFVHGTVYRAHLRYGPVVRVRPNELSFSTAQAWKDICAVRSQSTAAAAANPSRLRELPRYRPFYKIRLSEPDGIFSSVGARHAQLRSALAHGFSDHSMRAQEPTFKHYADKLLANLDARSSTPGEKRPVNLCDWFAYVTFDIISDLVYDQTFGCLDSADYHEMPALLFSSNVTMAYLRILNELGFGTALSLFISVFENDMMRVRKRTWDALRARLDMGAERDHEFIAGLVKEQKSGARFSFDEIKMTAGALIFAGSETTASLLAALTYLLGAHPEALAKATAEVRGAFETSDDITVVRTNGLEYLPACVREALRYMPPVATGLPRQIPTGGDVIDGVPVSGGVSCKSARARIVDGLFANSLHPDHRVRLSLVREPARVQLCRPALVPARALARRRPVRLRRTRRVAAVPARHEQLHREEVGGPPAKWLCEFSEC